MLGGRQGVSRHHYLIASLALRGSVSQTRFHLIENHLTWQQGKWTAVETHHRYNDKSSPDLMCMLISTSLYCHLPVCNPSSHHLSSSPRYAEIVKYRWNKDPGLCRLCLKKHRRNNSAACQLSASKRDVTWNTVHYNHLMSLFYGCWSHPLCPNRLYIVSPMCKKFQPLFFFFFELAAY